MKMKKNQPGRIRVHADRVKFAKKLIKILIVCPDGAIWAERKQKCFCTDKNMKYLAEEGGEFGACVPSKFYEFDE